MVDAGVSIEMCEGVRIVGEATIIERFPPSSPPVQARTG
jgi:hypothetical protein